MDWLRTTISPNPSSLPPPPPANIEDGWEMFEDLMDPEETEDTQSSIHTIEHIKLNKSTLSETSSKKLGESNTNVNAAFPIPLSVIESTIAAINNSKIPEELSPRTHKPVESIARLKDKELKYRKLNKRGRR